MLSQRMAAEMQSENQEKKEKKTHDGGVRGFPSGCSGEEGNIKDIGSIPGSGRSPVGGHGNPLQYSCLETPMDRGSWWV